MIDTNYNYLLNYVLELFTNFICIIYIFFTISKIQLTKAKRIIVSICSIALPFSCAFLRISSVYYYRLLFLLAVILFIILSFKNETTTNTMLIILISVGISYAAEILSSIIIGTIFYVIGYTVLSIVLDFCISVLNIFIVFLLMKFNRLKNGFRFLEYSINVAFCFIIAGPILILDGIYKEQVNSIVLTLIIIGTILLCIGLFIWIFTAIARHYRKRLKLRAEEYSKIELAEKSKEIEKLTSENTSLSSIIHLDNHIIQSIETEINKLNNSELTDKLLISINQRNEYVNGTLLKSKNLPSTGNTDIDSVLADLYIKAASRGIDFNLNVDCDINYLLNNIITKDDFETLLRNTITNSIVDIENNPDTNGKILITISKPNDIYEFTIMDSGISDDENIKSISEIIENSNASIKTNKFDNNDSFTKSLTIRFDGLKNNTAL